MGKKAKPPLIHVARRLWCVRRQLSIPKNNGDEACLNAVPGTRDDHWMGIIGLIGKLFGIDAAAPPDVAKLDATTEAALARSLSALSAGERGWLTLNEARTLFSTEGAEYAFGELDQVGREKIESFAAQHQSVINFMPMVEQRVYFVRE
jgi:hypothetical protein